MKKFKIHVGETLKAGFDEKMFAEILERTENTVTFKRYRIQKGEILDPVVKKADIMIRSLWDQNFEEQIGTAECFIGWADCCDDDDVCLGYFFSNQS